MYTSGTAWEMKPINLAKIVKRLQDYMRQVKHQSHGRTTDAYLTAAIYLSIYQNRASLM